MTPLEKAELIVIAAATAAAWTAMGSREWSPPLGNLAAWAAGLVFSQGLLRDLIRLALPRTESEKRRVVCLCAESVVGAGLLAAALALTLLGAGQSVTL